MPNNENKIKRGHIVVLSGPSGVGKGTVCKELVKKYPNLIHSISATTRLPREGEADGVNYFFVTREKFEQMMDEGEFLENFEIYGNRYGTPRKFVLDKVAEGKNVILEIDVQGALKIRELIPEAKLVFIVPPSEQVLYARLAGRNSETEDSLKRRFESAKSEIEMRTKYDYCVTNDKLDDCVADVCKILDSLGNV